MTRYEPVVPDGQHLGTSHEVDGAVTGHLFSDSDNRLQGHAAWREVEDEYSSSYDYEPPRPLTQEEIERAAEMAALIILGIIRGVQWASPRVKRWWDGRAAPKLKLTWQSFRGGKEKKDAKATDHGHLTASRARFVASPAGVEIAVVKSKVRMTSAEWEQRLRAMLAAGAFQEEQRRILANAQIEDDEHVLEVGTSQLELTPQQFTQRVQAMLEANPSLLSDTSAAEIIRVLKRPGPDSNLALQS
jgi:hypothetical protein